MESKYYTPTINEFYVGFEYEYLSSTGWKKVIIKDSEDMCYLLFDINTDWLKDYEDIIRVKYLDKEDIESLEFICIGEANNKVEKEFQKFINDEDNYLLETSFDNELTITFEKGFGITNDYTLFQGIIKNKSELKKLLKQLDIL
jgi:hypothetical protein